MPAFLPGERHPRAIYSADTVRRVRQAIAAAPRNKGGRLARGIPAMIAFDYEVSIDLVYDLGRRVGNRWQSVTP